MKTTPIAALFAILFLSSGSSSGQSAEMASRIKRVRVQSSNVASIGYSSYLHALEIEFARGAIYRFLHVPHRVYRQLLAAESKGHFIAAEIRGQYEFVRVRPRPRADSSRQDMAAGERE